MPLLGTDAKAIAGAAELLLAGHRVAFPTETVYGLGADALNDEAVRGIFLDKGRPADHPLIVHVKGAAAAEPFVSVLPRVAERLMAVFWPGPVTMVLRRREGMATVAAGGLRTIGLRSPSHPVAIELLASFALQKQGPSGLAAPSANRFGRISPTRAADVLAEFGERMPVIDGGETPVGIESAIIDLSRYETVGAVLLRPGSLSRSALEERLGEPLALPSHGGPRVSGALPAHYAPAKPLRLVKAEDLKAIPADVAVFSFAKPTPEPVNWRLAPDSPDRYATMLYRTLRDFDMRAVSEIWFESPPQTESWDGINDRLRRAVRGSGTG